MMAKGTLLMTVVLGLAAAASAAEQDTRVFEMRTYWAPAGKLDAMNARFREHTLKLFEKHGMVSIGYWMPIDNPENKMVYLLAFPSREAREASWKAFFADADWQAVKKQTEADGKIVDRVESVLLSATDYSPKTAASIAEPRVFELRTYTASEGNLGHLNARFRDHTLKLFERHGISNFGYWTPLEGQPGAGQTLVYLISHKSVAAAKASFDAFRQDPDWLAARQASEEKAGGSLTAPGGVQSLFLQVPSFRSFLYRATRLMPSSLATRVRLFLCRSSNCRISCRSPCWRADSRSPQVGLGEEAGGFLSIGITRARIESGRSTRSSDSPRHRVTARWMQLRNSRMFPGQWYAIMASSAENEISCTGRRARWA
jgi:hypothetical protein